MAKFATGIYTPKFPEKYIGKGKPRFRSGWEMTMMMFLDNDKHILYWASESVVIKYRHPLTGKYANYIPDFFVVYVNKHNQQVAEIVEIKPKKQSIIESKASNRDKVTVAINHAKWTACAAYCKQQKLGFRVLTEEQIYHTGR